MNESQRPPAKKTPNRVTSQGLLCVWHGIGLPNWIRLLAQRPEIRPKRWGRVASVTLFAASNSFWHVMEKLVYGRRIARVELKHPPIFILGHWRCGTTLLHNLLTRDPQFTFPNLYQVLFPGHFLLTERIVTALTSWLLPRTRPMDNMPAGWNMPQEDEAALMLMTLASPYLVSVFPNDRSRYDRFYELTDVPDSVREAWKEAFLHFCRKLTLRQPRTIVFKSPPHTRRIPLLLEMFPQAKFVHIVRDPYTVFSSTMHLRRVMCEANGFGRPDPDYMRETILQSYLEYFERFRQDRERIPPGHLHELRFEDLEADPVGQLRILYETLGLDGFRELENKLRAELPAHRQYRKNRYELSDKERHEIYRRWRPAFEAYGYPSGLEERASEVA